MPVPDAPMIPMFAARHHIGERDPGCRPMMAVPQSGAHHQQAQLAGLAA